MFKICPTLAIQNDFAANYDHDLSDRLLPATLNESIGKHQLVALTR